MAIRQVTSIVVLPGTIAVIIPLWIARRNSVAFITPHGAISLLLVVTGVVLLLAGVALFAACLFLFWTRGRGTLAPWDPPRRFVVEGPYRYVRNPMISGVVFVLVGEALVLRSTSHGLWASAFALANAVYIPMVEEPMLEARFGEPYRRYRSAVRRFIPHLRAWTP
jgi:protein-S-isoprenylcysteine O-methyltransferase Ste14